ncbi:phytanoyl-CoA dioxygenase family protein [Cytobacillus pseudoceanisediminis]|uniref:phytanoyl-CoA dioxygenase family protein n=1 Tax=Cytobacillus pseudoceanisediminis TaxID=3051614 RepID=UPI003C3094E0
MSGKLSQEQKEAFKRDGFLVVKNVYTQDEVDDINQEYKKIWMDKIREGKIVQDPYNPIGSLFPRLHDYHRENKAILNYILKPEAIEVLEELVGEEVLVISGNYIYKGPGTGESPIHQDNYSIGVANDTTYAIFVCLDDCDEENGCLQFARGSQEMDLQSPKIDTDDIVKYFSDAGQEVEIPEKYEIINAIAARGDIVIFDGNVLHGSKKNTSTNRFRRSLLTFFAKASIERITMNFNQLINKKGERVRKRLNTAPKITENKGLFTFKDADYYKHNGWK